MKIGDLMQKFFMSNPKRAMWFLSTMPASFWEKQGRKKALSTFREAAKKVPAYKKFLEERGVKVEEIKTFEDFKDKVPIMDKKSYLLKFSAEELLSDSIDNMYTFSTSSGTSGDSFIWYRTYSQDWPVPKFTRAVYDNNWQIGKYSTLWIVTHALGAWIAGEFVAWIMKQITADPRIRMNVATPGSNLEQVLLVLKKVAPKYDQVILSGYPTFVKLVIDEAIKSNIDFKEINLKLHVAGESITEHWRSIIKKKIGVKGAKEDLYAILDTYGCADAGGLGFGFLLTNLIRDIARTDKEFCFNIFGRKEVPTVMQYNPLAYFIESLPNGHISITYNSAMSLIKYDIKDIGGTLPFCQMEKALQKYGYNIYDILKKRGVHKEYKIWKLPFVFIYGRENALSIASANIFASHLEDFISSSEEINSFKLTKKENIEGDIRFMVYLELKRGLNHHKDKLNKLNREYSRLVLEELTKNNPDFNQAYLEDPKTCYPHVEIYPFRKGPFSEDSKRTKPRIII